MSSFDAPETEQVAMFTAPLGGAPATQIKDHACGLQSPHHDLVKARVRCNRPANHDGETHQQIRAYDFAVLAEWTGLDYSVLPGQVAYA